LNGNSERRKKTKKKIAKWRTEGERTKKRGKNGNVYLYPRYSWRLEGGRERKTPGRATSQKTRPH